jgi:hypothetical protein
MPQGVISDRLTGRSGRITLSGVPEEGNRVA